MRIASLSPAATELLFAMGLGDKIVCVDQFSNFPDVAKKLPHVKDHQHVRPDDLKEFNPELVITGTVIQQKLHAELEAAGFAALHQDLRTINALYESIRQLGVILDRPSESEKLVLSMQQGFNAVKKKAAYLPTAGGNARAKVYIEEWHQPPMVSGNWVPEVIRIAGGQSFPINDGELSREVTFEQVMAFDPDLIVISWCGAGLLAPKELLLERKGWDALRAVREGHVRVIDDSLLSRPGPRLCEGAQRIFGWLFEMLH